jgi:hypothetical protein
MASLFCELVEGRSDTRTFALPREGESALRIMVGSAQNATWQVIATGVRPHHVEIAWHDGAGWVLNRGGHPDVRLGGKPVAGEWLRVEGPSRLEFGSAVLQVRASAGPPPVGDFESTRVVFEMEHLEEPRTSEPDTAPSAKRESFPAPPSVRPGPMPQADSPRAPQPAASGVRSKSNEGGSTPVAIETPKKKPIVRARFLVLSVIVIGVVSAGFVLSRVLPQIAARRADAAPAEQASQSESPFTLPEPTITAYDATTDGEVAALEARAVREYAAGQMGDALATYEELASRRPEHRGFQIALEILRERCENGGRECARSSP